jgi:hypothetical protein
MLAVFALVVANLRFFAVGSELTATYLSFSRRWRQGGKRKGKGKKESAEGAPMSLRVFVFAARPAWRAPSQADPCACLCLCA